MRLNGKIRWWKSDKGYGRIDADDGELYFASFADVETEGFAELIAGEAVTFDFEGNMQGDLRRAEVIRRVAEPYPRPSS